MTMNPMLIVRLMFVAATLAMFAITPRGGIIHMNDPGDGYDRVERGDGTDHSYVPSSGGCT